MRRVPGNSRNSTRPSASLNVIAPVARSTLARSFGSSSVSVCPDSRTWYAGAATFSVRIKLCSEGLKSRVKRTRTALSSSGWTVSHPPSTGSDTPPWSTPAPASPQIRAKMTRNECVRIMVGGWELAKNTGAYFSVFPIRNPFTSSQCIKTGNHPLAVFPG